MFHGFHYFFRPAPAAVFLLVAACSSVPGLDDAGPAIFSPERSEDERTLAVLLRESRSLPSPQAEAAALEAARVLVDMGRDGEAAELLAGLDTASLDIPLAVEILSERARLMMEMNRPGEALTLLSSQSPAPLAQLAPPFQKRIRLLRARAYLDTNQLLPSAQERIYVDRLMAGPEVAENHEEIWKALTALPAEQISRLADNALTYEFQGWYELAHIGKAYQYNLDRQVVELERWLRSRARHPAADSLPQAMRLVTILAAERPANVALLLPLKTPAGQVIRDAFMTAYFDVQSFGGKVPVVHFYDTTGVTDIVALHEMARENGAEMIIGPLQKPLVARLQQVADLGVPTLALNAVEGARPRSRELYLFSLSPENEARQIALRAWEDGHRRAAVLSLPDAAGDDYYQRKRESFIAQWRELGGRVVEQETFRDDYTAVIERLLNLDDSGYRREQLSDLLGETLVFTPRRRRDIDCIFLIAQPEDARQINPSLAYLYAGDIPVYATQDVYSGMPRPLADVDLNGVLFADSPWLLSGEDELKQKAESLFPQNTALNLRLQAFGVDAFRLYPRLQQLESNGRINGATGLLTMDAGRNIGQELYWARFSEGRAVLVDEPF